MSERYKIGDISKLLGIPVQTLRYYEEQGIVHPQKDDQTGYRFYNAWDLNNLIDTVHYRALDFNLNQVEHILNSDTLEDIRKKYAQQEVFMLEKIEEYKTKLDMISRQRQKMEFFEHDLGKFRLCKGPGLMFYRHRMRNVFQSKEGDTKIEGMKEGMQEWLGEIPKVTPTFMIPYNTLNEKNEEAMQYWWGWSMPVAESLQRGMKVSAHNEYLPEGKCLYTVFEAGGKGTFAKCFFEKVFLHVNRSDYTMTGNPYGRLIMKEHDESGMRRYFEVWIPIGE